MTGKIYIGGAALAVALAATVAVADARGMGDGMRGEGMGPRMDFATLDADGDGSITAEDLAALRDRRFATLDADGDGQVSRQEFTDRAVAQAGERAGAMFDRIDADGDGRLSRDAIAARRGPRPDADRLIARFDSDGDGAVSQAEFEAARASWRDRMERRGDHGGMRHGGGWRHTD